MIRYDTLTQNSFLNKVGIGSLPVLLIGVLTFCRCVTRRHTQYLFAGNVIVSLSVIGVHIFRRYVTLTQCSFLEHVGIVSMSVLGVQIFHGLWRILYDHVLAQRIFHHNVPLREMGEWAVVTGATAGIGQAYAFELARQNLNIILISHSERKLRLTASNIAKKYQVETRIIVADFNDNSKKVYEKIAGQIYDCEVGVLINNVGISYPQPEYFTELSASEKIFSSIIKCNIYSVTYMCMIVLPIMLRQGRGVVVNVSSTTAKISSRMLAVSAASKAYIEKFSCDLNSEYGQHGIHVQCLIPGYVPTKRNSLKFPPWFAPSPTTYVEGATKLLGIQGVCTGYIPHTILINVINILEDFAPTLTIWFIRRTMETVRDLAVSKYYMV